MAGEFKQPWLYGEYKSAAETPMQAEIYSNSPEMESQWKQPWKHDNYPKMESEWAFPGSPGYPLPPGTYGPGGDCTPKGDAVGGGAVDPCNPGVNCGQWVFSCAHKITSFAVVQSFGWIQSIVYSANDTVTVTVCWNEADRIAGVKVGIKAIGANGQDYISEVDMNTCCPDKTVCQTACGSCAVLSIGHSTHQMTCGGSTQTLSASGGGGKYVWTLFGGGSLSTNHGPSTIYTPPVTNADCAYNPEITLGDCCGTTTNLKIAVNCYGSEGPAYAYNWDSEPAEGCVHSIYQQDKACDGSNFGASVGCGSCDCPWTGCCCSNPDPPCNEPELVCSQARVVAGCSCPNCGPLGNVDTRTAAMKTAGCCPEALLV